MFLLPAQLLFTNASDNAAVNRFGTGTFLKYASKNRHFEVVIFLYYVIIRYVCIPLAHTHGG